MKLESSDGQIIKSSDENLVSISGYKFKWSITSFFRLLLFSGSILVECFLLSRATEITSLVVLATILILTVLFAIILHTKTKIQFSTEHIKIRYGWLPFARKRKVKNLKNVYIEYNDNSSGNDIGSGFTYLVLVFSKQWNIKIIVDQLTRKERDAITGRLSYLRHKFSSD